MKTRSLLPTLCGVLAALALFGIMVLTLVDVSGRKLLDASIPGSLELTELLMVVVIFSSLPLVSMKGEHVVFDSLDSMMPAWLRRVQQVLVDLFCALALAGIAGLMWKKGLQMTSYGDTTAQLKWSLGPFVQGMSVMCALTAAVHALHILRPPAERDDSSAPGAGETL